MGKDGLQAIAERNARAMRPRRSILSYVYEEIYAAFDKTVPVAERRPKQIALAIIGLLVVGVVATYVLWPRGNAPGGEVRSSTGASVELDSLYENERVIAVFYPGKGEFDPFLEELEKNRMRFKGKVIAISSHSAAHAATLRDRLKLGFEIYVDPTFEVMREWKVPFLMADSTTFAVFVIEKGGKIGWKKIGQPVATWDEIATK